MSAYVISIICDRSAGLSEPREQGSFSSSLFGYLTYRWEIKLYLYSVGAKSFSKQSPYHGSLAHPRVSFKYEVTTFFCCIMPTPHDFLEPKRLLPIAKKILQPIGPISIRPDVFDFIFHDTYLLFLIHNSCTRRSLRWWFFHSWWCCGQCLCSWWCHLWQWIWQRFWR